MKRILSFVLVLALSGPFCANAKTYRLASPNDRLQVEVEFTEQIKYAVSLRGAPILAPSPISLKLAGQTNPAEGVAVEDVSVRDFSRVLRPVVPRKRREIVDKYRELRIRLNEGKTLTFRAYDEAIAYRWETTIPGEVIVESEQATFRFVENGDVWFPREKSTFTSQEQNYERVALSDLGPQDFAATGVLIGLSGGRKVFLSEADLQDYPGMFVRGGSDGEKVLVGKFDGFPLETKNENDRLTPVVRYADYLAKTKGSRTYPWRVLLVSEKDGELLDSEIIYLLASPCQIDDPSWIKPGRVAWDWWNALNLTGVDFRSGVNTATYKYFIDFASDHGIEYIILDEGWSKTTDLLSVSPEIDLPELMEYANERDVGIILWVIWRTLDEQLEPALDQFAKWGAAGIKVDFMSRDDQWMVNYYHRIAREAAQRRLLVDFHGCYKPTGLRRAYPNVITREGVLGMEYNKWSELVTPEHDVTIPFIRMVSGPMDFTPGAMRNAVEKHFTPVFERPMSQGTRCHQLAMYVVYESPLQMLCDTPTNYQRELECMEFLTAVPTVWDESHVVAAKVSDYVVIARRRGEKWFLGAMTDGEVRDLEINLSFLPDGNFHMKAWADGTNADRHAEDFHVYEKHLNKNTTFNVHLAAGGGWTAILTPQAGSRPAP